MNVIGPVQNTNVIRYADFFRLGMQDGTYYFATTPAPISVRLDPLSSTYTPFTALGQLVSVGSVQRDIKSTANETTITLVGVDTAMLGLVLNAKIKGSSIDLWHGFFDSNNELITSITVPWINSVGNQIPWTNTYFSEINWTSAAAGTGVYKYFGGYVNSFSISEQWMEETRSYVGVVTISASSFQLILQNRTAGRYTNDNAWQAAMPIGTPPGTDTSMNRVNYISTINYAFGKTP